jgi:hypothetical protein
VYFESQESRLVEIPYELFDGGFPIADDTRGYFLDAGNNAVIQHEDAVFPTDEHLFDEKGVFFETVFSNFKEARQEYGFKKDTFLIEEMFIGREG